MVRIDGFEKCVVAALLFVASATPAAVTSAPIELDRNHDGKADKWVWEDDQATTAVTDEDFDGECDHLQVSRKLESGLFEIRFDTDYDGEFEEMRVYDDPHKFLEIWRRRNGESIISYSKRDEKARTFTWGTALQFGSRNIAGAVTRLLPDVEIIPGVGWIDHREGVSVMRLPNGELHSIKEWNESNEEYKEILLANFQRTSGPCRVEVREWDLVSSESKHLKIKLSLRDQNCDGQYDRVVRETDENGASNELFARDINYDGAFDEFRLVFADGTTREERDQDFDGLLDVVENRDAKGEVSRLVGVQIPDRKLRTVPIPEDKIEALLERARAGPPAR